MNKRYLHICLLFLMTLAQIGAQAQTRDSFSRDQLLFLEELKEIMTLSKIALMETAFESFEKSLRGGVFAEEEWQKIWYTSNLIQDQRLNANPYIRDYLECLQILKSPENQINQFDIWHSTFNQMLLDEEHFNANKIKKFLTFSKSFFNNKQFQDIEGGVQWAALTDDFKINYFEGKLVLSFKDTRLIGKRNNDSISILETAGEFFLYEDIWIGKGGIVPWGKRAQEEIHVELTDYEIDTRKSLYEAKNCRLVFPDVFPGKKIAGSFEDKITTRDEAVGEGFPRFKSIDTLLQIDRLGPGIRYTGGFKMEGNTIYGFGGTRLKGTIRVFDKDEKLKFRANADNFVVVKGERISAQSADVSMFFDSDSLYHPSVNLKYDIEKQELRLTRGQRGKDRNPFFDSYHEFNIESDKLDWYISRDSVIFGKKTLGIGGGGKSEVFFESLTYFDDYLYRRIQNIANFNPLASFKSIADKTGKTIYNASYLAEQLNPSYSVENIQSLLYELVSQGFINYDSDRREVTFKEKIAHYADASLQQVDYDLIKIRSDAIDNDNAFLTLSNKNLIVNEVESIEFSPSQKVALQPFGKQLMLLKDRNMDFDGRIYAGFSTLEGKDFHFKYDDFHIVADSIRYFDLYIPTGFLDLEGKPKAVPLLSRIEHLNGILLIDAPSNKSGREDIGMFPSFNSKSPGYVYYDATKQGKETYPRDSFYFEISPFHLNNLDNYTEGDIAFKGKLNSSNMMPEIEETLIIMGSEDSLSLGFTTDTPEEGLETYGDRGSYEGQLSLSHEGLLGKGKITYLGSETESGDIVFSPKQLSASAELFSLDEDREGSPEFPRAYGYDVKMDWRPYQDSMYIRSQERDFEIFTEAGYTLEGGLILTPGGLKANGELDWASGKLKSRLLSFGAFSVEADTAALSVKALDNPDKVAVYNNNVKGNIDFDQKKGHFEANDPNSPTDLPYNQYLTTMNTFDWDLDLKRVEFQSEEGKLAQFVSSHPDQDSLYFEGETATYELITSKLEIGGVPFIETCDALVYPFEGKVDIEPNGVMTPLTKAKIIASTENRYHVINRATVSIQGKKKYLASGFYEYNIGDKEQEIEFSDIVGQPVGKGSYSEKKTETRATGEVTESDSFYIDLKTTFKGTISLRAESKLLDFKGFAQLDIPDLPYREYFSVNSPGDKQDLTIKFDEPKSFDGFPIRNGLFLSKETGLSYPRVMMPLFFRKDRAVMDARGFFKYDKNKDAFIFGDSLKVHNPRELSGKLMTYSIPDGKITAEGIFDIGSKLNYIQVKAAGRGETSFAPPSDTLELKGVGTDLTLDVMAGITIPLPQNLLDVMLTDLKSSSFEALSVGYQPVDLFVKAVTELFPNMKDIDVTREALRSDQILSIPKKENPYTFLFSRLPLKWNPEYQSFFSARDRLGVAGVQGEMFNRMLKCYVEFKMPSNEDDRLYIFLESPSGYYYFFGYKQGILSTVSNNGAYIEVLNAMKNKERITKMSDGGFFEIQPAEESTARIFVNRVLDGRE